MTVENVVTESSTEAETSSSQAPEDTETVETVETAETGETAETAETSEVSEGEPEGIWVLMKVGADGVPQVAPGYEHFQPQSGQMYNCSELADGLYNCTVVDGPIHSTGNCSIVTSDLSEIQKCIENTGGATKPATVPGGSDQPEPSAPAGSVVGEATDTTTTTTTSSPSTTTDTAASTTEEAGSGEAESDKPLDKMSYKEVCGRTPWLNETFRKSQASPRSGRKIGGSDVFWRQFYRQPKIVNGKHPCHGSMSITVLML